MARLTPGALTEKHRGISGSSESMALVFAARKEEVGLMVYRVTCSVLRGCCA